MIAEGPSLLKIEVNKMPRDENQQNDRTKKTDDGRGNMGGQKQGQGGQGQGGNQGGQQRQGQQAKTKGGSEQPKQGGKNR